MLSITASRLPSGHIDHFRWLVRDLTERKRMEAEVRQRAEQFENANQAKDEFLAMLGHEQRNPLVPLRNLAPILAKDCSPERIDWAMGVLRRQVANLTRLVDDLLDASRLNRGKMEVRPTTLDLVSVLQAAVEDQRRALADGGLSLEIELPDAPVRVRGDATRLSQVRDNLLHNAAKFTPSGGRVSVRLAVDNGQADVSVRDTGRGIAPELLPHLFDAFVQGKGHQGGLGLGVDPGQGPRGVARRRRQRGK
jgi:signal transduction histidine kinase